jgi:VanZ family protein
MRNPARRLFVLRCGAWSCVVLIAYLSLTPMQVRTPAPAGMEHAIAYAATAGLMVLAYRSRPVWLIAGLLAVYSGLMELLQNFVPSRHPGLDGVLWSSGGAIIGGIGH